MRRLPHISLLFGFLELHKKPGLRKLGILRSHKKRSIHRASSIRRCLSAPSFTEHNGPLVSSGLSPTIYTISTSYNFCVICAYSPSFLRKNFLVFRELAGLALSDMYLCCIALVVYSGIIFACTHLLLFQAQKGRLSRQLGPMTLAPRSH